MSLLIFVKVQGGDPTKTGYGGESIFGKPFEDEFHEKLTHNRAGLVSMANSGFLSFLECLYMIQIGTDSNKS